MSVTAAIQNHSSFINIRFDSVAWKPKIKKNKKETYYEICVLVINNAALGYILLLKQLCVKCFIQKLKKKETP